jgi:hypothetical protein
MNVAVGRLQLSISLAAPAPPRHVAKHHRANAPTGDTLAHAYQAERRLEAVEADRRRWATDHTLHNVAR